MLELVQVTDKTVTKEELLKEEDDPLAVGSSTDGHDPAPDSDDNH